MDFSSRLKLLTEEKIAALLDGKRNRDAYLEIRGSDHRSATNSKCAAVLCPLVLKPDGWHMFLIRRSDLVADHRGQVAFPGGACEASDQTLEDTALREASEEIGVAPDDVRILGRLREMVTVSSYRIMPIVGTFDWPYSLTPSAEEVSRIFSIPLEWLINPENQETRTLYRSGKDVPVIYFKPFDGEILWGATARMVDNLLDILELR